MQLGKKKAGESRPFRFSFISTSQHQFLLVAEVLVW